MASLCSGVAPSADMAGMAYVQAAMNNVFGTAGVVFITVALILFAFTTLLGNYYFAETGNRLILANSWSAGIRITSERIATRRLVLIVFRWASLWIAWTPARCSDGTDGAVYQRVPTISPAPTLAGASPPGRPHGR
ncbi:MAG: alanine:cation symporter family protein [Clostridia bacterium]